MNKTNIYENKVEGESLKLQPKAMFSTEYKDRKNYGSRRIAGLSTDHDDQKESYETQVAHYRKYIS